MHISWLFSEQPPYGDSQSRHLEGEAARDALRKLTKTPLDEQGYPQFHSWSPREGRMWPDGRPWQFEGWQIGGCVIENPETPEETFVFQLVDSSAPHGTLPDRLVFPPERADPARNWFPLLGVEFFT